jgi:hypothetical protein
MSCGLTPGFVAKCSDSMANKPIKITFEHYGSYCGDGCCQGDFIKTLVNGEELDFGNTDTETIVKGILEKLGYNVTIESTYED